MTDRVLCLTVALEGQPRTDDVESLVEAIKHFRGVISVGIGVRDHGTWSCEQRVRADIEARLFNALRKEGE